MKCAFHKRGECSAGKHKHHVVTQRKLKDHRQGIAVLAKQPNRRLNEQQARVLATPITRILKDERNLLQLCNLHHHRVHHFGLRLTPKMLPAGFREFCIEYGLEGAYDRAMREMAR